MTVQEYEKLAKRINQRMLRASRAGAANRDFEALQRELQRVHVKTGSEYLTFPSRAKQLSQMRVDELGRIAKRYADVKLSSGAASPAKEQKLTEAQAKYQRKASELNKRLGKLRSTPAIHSYDWEQLQQDLQIEGLATPKGNVKSARSLSDKQARRGLQVVNMYLNNRKLNPNVVTSAVRAIYNNLSKWSASYGVTLTERDRYNAALVIDQYNQGGLTGYGSDQLITLAADNPDKSADINDAIKQWGKNEASYLAKYGSITYYLQQEWAMV